MASSKDDVTVVVTSCGRYDLLDRTLRSFRIFNSDPRCNRIVVVEDGIGDPGAVCAAYGAELIRLGSPMGQPAAIDVGYAVVQTPYIFHCEDDWEFYRSGFVERSRIILEVDLSCVCVWLRAWADTNHHPLSFKSDCGSFGVLASGFRDLWHGFTWNPGLRRWKDYIRVAPFTQMSESGVQAERLASKIYRELGYRALILDQSGYVRHIGSDRHVE